MGKRLWQIGLLWLALAGAFSSTASAQHPYAAYPSGPPAAPVWNAPWQHPAQRPPAPPHPAVVRIVAPEKEAVSYGSGTLVDVRGEHGLVVTNWHVVRDATQNIEVVFPDGFHCAARVLKTDKDWDLAALAVWRPNVEPVKLADSPPRPGDVLTIAGYGSGNYRAATGRCTQFVAPGVRMPFDMVEISTEARQGDSGGPIFNTRGELAGVLFGAGRGTTSGSHSNRVSLFLASVAPELQRPDASNIAVRGGGLPPLDAMADGRSVGVPPLGAYAATSPPPVRPFAPAAVQPPPDPPAAFAAKPTRSPNARSPVDGLTSVAPFHDEKAAPLVNPIAPVDHLGAVAFGTPPGVRPLEEPSLTEDKSPRLEASVDLSRPSPGLSWQAVAGDSLLSQIKTVLAGVGLLALLFHGLRLTGKSTPAKSRKKKRSEDEDDEDTDDDE